MRLSIVIMLLLLFQSMNSHSLTKVIEISSAKTKGISDTSEANDCTKYNNKHNEDILCLVNRNNLVINPSFEIWKNHMPSNWRVIINTPDFIKNGVVFFPIINKIVLHSGKCIQQAADGHSFVNLASTEIIEGELNKPLDKDKKYIIQLYINRFFLQQDEIFDHIPIKFSKNQAPTQLVNDEISNYLEIPIENQDALISNTWQKIQLEFIAEGGERFFQIGVFLKSFENLGLKKHLVNFSIDNFTLHKIQEHTIFFDSNQSQLKEPSKSEINQIIQQFHPTSKISIQAYASTYGEDEMNTSLSEARAIAVKNHIESNFNKSTISVQFFGEKASKENDRNYQKVIIKEIIHTKDPAKIALNEHLQQILREVWKNDQKYRLKYDSMIKINLVDTVDLFQTEKLINYHDSINRTIIDSLVENSDYLGLSKVGLELMDVVFYVILHSPIDYRLQYMSMIEKAESSCEFSFSLYPYIVDRNLLDQGKKQIYGTQFRYDKIFKSYVPFPIKDKVNLNERRQKYFLSNFEDYVILINQNSF